LKLIEEQYVMIDSLILSFDVFNSSRNDKKDPRERTIKNALSLYKQNLLF